MVILKKELGEREGIRVPSWFYSLSPFVAFGAILLGLLAKFIDEKKGENEKKGKRN